VSLFAASILIAAAPTSVVIAAVKYSIVSQHNSVTPSSGAIIPHRVAIASFGGICSV
jgi:hypothetical protein